VSDREARRIEKPALSEKGRADRLRRLTRRLRSADGLDRDALRNLEQAGTESIERPVSAKVMDEAIDLAIAGQSPYPERAAFIDAEAASAGREIKRAADEGLSIVLVAGDGSFQVLMPEAAGL
jgi:hypothetical protein